MQRRISRSSSDSKWKCPDLLLLVLILLSVCVQGCACLEIRNPPPCPQVSEGMVGDLDSMVSHDLYPDLELWISEMDRYCYAVMVSY
jgi:hypothetical protein